MKCTGIIYEITHIIKCTEKNTENNNRVYVTQIETRVVRKKRNFAARAPYTVDKL